MIITIVLPFPDCGNQATKSDVDFFRNKGLEAARNVIGENITVVKPLKVLLRFYRPRSKRYSFVTLLRNTRPYLKGVSEAVGEDLLSANEMVLKNLCDILKPRIEIDIDIKDKNERN